MIFSYPTQFAQLGPLSDYPMIAVVLLLGVVGVLILIFALTKTKVATNEARVGQFEIILLPNGKRLTGLVTLARKEVSPEFTFELSRNETIKKDEAKKLQETFEELHFYALRSGRDKCLIVSAENLESPEFGLVTSETFVFPFGFVSRRLVIGDATEKKRAGWRVISLSPRNLKTGLSPKVFEKMSDLSDACASIKEAAIRIKKEAPWKEVAHAVENQLKDAHNELATVKGECAKLRLALSSKSLFGEPEKPVKLESIGKEGLLSFWRVVVAVVTFFLCFTYLPQTFPHIIDPLLPSLVLGAITFALYPRVRDRLKLVMRT